MVVMHTRKFVLFMKCTRICSEVYCNLTGKTDVYFRLAESRSFEGCGDCRATFRVIEANRANQND